MFPLKPESQRADTHGRRGVRIYSALNIRGYARATVAYVRCLLNAGVPVQWIPLECAHDRSVAMRQDQLQAWAREAADDAAMQDIPAMLAATCHPVQHSVVLAHTTPESWPRLFEDGKRNVGYTTWEADAVPAHWLDLLDRADVVCVPSAWNERVFAQDLAPGAVIRIPHIRRHRWNELGSDELHAIRSAFAIPTSHFVFYSIDPWQPRKNLHGLLQAYVQEFQATDPVVLVLKTSPVGVQHAGLGQEVPTEQLARQAMDAWERTLGRPLPRIVLLPYDLSGRAIDALHQIGDCYVSLSHGEGWGLSAFDAASLGRPVVMTAGGGQADYLGSDHPGAVPARMESAPVFPPQQPSLWPSQRWAIPDLEGAAHLMRTATRRPDAWRIHASQRARQICNAFAEPVIAPDLLHALGV